MIEIIRHGYLKIAATVIIVVMIGPQLFAGQDSRKDRPNIVFILADQMRASAMGSMGNSVVKTPNLDRLAEQGLLLKNAISLQPVCTPYRAQLMTGRYGHVTGVIENDIKLPNSEITLAEILKDDGYATGYIGKWHLAGYRQDPVAKEDRQGWGFWAVRNVSHDHNQTAYWLNDAREPVMADGWEPDVQTDLAIEYIKANKSGPFILMLSFGPPHPPYGAPPEYMKRYDGVDIVLRPNVPQGPKREKTKNKIKKYYAMISSLDDCVGRIMTTLDQLGLVENTILAFSSDHGDMLGSQGHRQKRRPWEESINIPLIIRYPKKVKAGQIRDWLIASVDVMPTLLGLAGAEIPDKVQGIDHTAMFTGKGKKEREAVFLFNGKPGGGRIPDWRGIRTKEWLFAFHAKGDWVMYDLKGDPYELNNLVDNPKYAAKKEELRRQINAMREQLKENLPLKGDYPPPIRISN
jgi:arylsulfatase A-like enzyme